MQRLKCDADKIHLSALHGAQALRPAPQGDQYPTYEDILNTSSYSAQDAHYCMEISQPHCLVPTATKESLCDLRTPVWGKHSIPHPRSVIGSGRSPAVANLRDWVTYLFHDSASSVFVSPPRTLSLSTRFASTLVPASFATALFDYPPLGGIAPMDVVTTLWEAAKALYEASQEVKENNQACVAIQQTVNSLARTINACPHVSQRMEEQLSALVLTLRELTKSLREIAIRNLLYRILHRKSIRCKLDDAHEHLQTATSLFQVGAQAEIISQMQEVKINIQRISDAQHKDDLVVEKRYEELLKSSDVDMINTLGLEDNQMPDAMIALSKHMRDMPDGVEKLCVEKGLDALRRRTTEMVPDVDDFTLSSYEVTIRYNEKLGAGGFAKVYRGTYRDGQTVAVKVLSDGAPACNALQQEVDVWKSLSHPHILQFIGVCPTADPPFMVCAFKPNGNVLDYLRKKPTASRHKILHDAAMGLAYLHEKKVVHGDIKATNILIDEDETACLADFGLSRVKLQTTMALNIDPKPQRGTVRWMAPEQLGGSSASRKTDIYSFAMTIYETFTGRPPFPEHDDSLVFIMVHDRGFRPHLDDVKQEARDLGLQGPMWEAVENCWKQDPKERWTAMELSEKLYKLRKWKPVQNNRPSGSAQASATLMGQSVSAGSSFPPPRSPPFLRPQDSPRPRPSETPNSAPVASRPELAQVSPNTVTPPVLPPVSPDDAAPTIVAPVQFTFTPPQQLVDNKGTSVQAPPRQPVYGKPTSAQEPTQSSMQPLPSGTSSRYEVPGESTAHHVDRPQPIHSSTTPAQSRHESVVQAAPTPFRSETIPGPRPLSPASIVHFDSPYQAGPLQAGPRQTGTYLNPLTIEGQPGLRQLSGPAPPTSGGLFSSPSNNRAALPTVGADAGAKSRPTLSIPQDPISSQGRGQTAPRTEPMHPKPLPPAGSIAKSVSGGATYSRPDLSVVEQDPPSPASDVQTPSPASPHRRYSDARVLLPEDHDQFRELFTDAYAQKFEGKPLNLAALPNNAPLREIPHGTYSRNDAPNKPVTFPPPGFQQPAVVNNPIAFPPPGFQQPGTVNKPHTQLPAQSQPQSQTKLPPQPVAKTQLQKESQPPTKYQPPTQAPPPAKPQSQQQSQPQSQSQPQPQPRPQPLPQPVQISQSQPQQQTQHAASSQLQPQPMQKSQTYQPQPQTQHAASSQPQSQAQAQLQSQYATNLRPQPQSQAPVKPHVQPPQLQLHTRPQAPPQPR